MLVIHPTGNRNVRAVLETLERRGLLERFFTTIAVDPDSPVFRLLPPGFRAEMLRRSFPVPPSRISGRALREAARMVLPKLGFTGVVAHESGWASVDAVYRDLDESCAKALPRLARDGKIKQVYAYEDGALETFKAAKKLGMTCVYDLPIAYWEKGRSLMNEEAERLPAWGGTLGGGILDSKEKTDRKTQELELADIVVGPGSFVMDSLPEWAGEKRRIVSPFGSPHSPPSQVIEDAESKRLARFRSGKKLRVLFAGSMGQRKGLGDLFEAMKTLNRQDVELVVMGSLLEAMSFYREQFPDFTYESGRPHSEVLDLMRTCDVFCLPSIVEGRALVMQEAMSQGLPLIITPNTGGADLIHEGETGFLIPIRSPEAIAEKIAWFAGNRDRISEMSRAAMAHAANYTWEAYGNAVVDGILQD